MSLLLALSLAACMSRATTISVHSVDRLRVTEVRGPQARIELALSVQTNAPVDSTVTVLAYEIALAGGPVLARGGKLAPLRVPAGGIVAVLLPVALALADLPADLPARVGSGALPYRAVVWIEAHSAVGRTQHRLEPAGQAPLGEAFAAVVDSIFDENAAQLVGVGPFGISGAELVIGVDLELPGRLPFPLHVTGVRYAVSLSGVHVGRGESRAPFTVQPTGGGRGAFELRVPIIAVPEAVKALARGDRELQVEGMVDIEPIGPIRTVPFRARTRVR
jgi:LEA14-like dessication related protein